MLLPFYPAGAWRQNRIASFYVCHSLVKREATSPKSTNNSRSLLGTALCPTPQADNDSESFERYSTLSRTSQSYTMPVISVGSIAFYFPSIRIQGKRELHVFCKIIHLHCKHAPFQVPNLLKLEYNILMPLQC